LTINVSAKEEILSLRNMNSLIAVNAASGATRLVMGYHLNLLSRISFVSSVRLRSSNLSGTSPRRL